MGVDSRPMTDEERGQFLFGVDKSIRQPTEARFDLPRQIQDTAAERDEHVQRVEANRLRDEAMAKRIAQDIASGRNLGFGEGKRPEGFKHPDEHYVSETPAVIGDVSTFGDTYTKTVERAQLRNAEIAAGRTMIVDVAQTEPPKKGLLERLKFWK